jgi:carboxyl-terminal processing protease
MGQLEMSKTKTISLTVGAFVAGALISLNFPALADKEAKPGLPIDELRTFAEVYSAIKQSYVEPVEDKKMITNAISGMLSNLDPHSTYLDADAFKDLQVSTQGEFGGLGIEVGMEDGLVKVVSPIEDTPAYRAGVKAGDLIFKLDDTPVKGLTLSDAVKKMRGKPKTPIKLSIIRKGETKPIEITLIREVIKVQSVKSKLVEPGYGWVRVTQFQENTVAEVAKHVSALYKDGNKLNGLVLDLRNDPGGLLNGAIGVSAAFLPPDVKVVSTDGRTEDAKQEFRARTQDYLRGTREDPLKSMPIEAKKVSMVVLVNGGSASASEIVAGALQDHKRAIIVGTQTFGKGSVQSVLPLPGNTAIKLTTARYYTPEGRSIQAKGITPDIVVEESANGASPGMRVREADLDRHLSNDREKEAAKEAAKPEAKGQAKPVKPGKDKKEDAEEEMPQRLEYATKGDYQFQQALNLLKGLQIMQSKAQ